MTTLVVHVEDCIQMTLRCKMALNGWSVHFVKCGITQHAKKLWMNFMCDDCEDYNDSE